MAVLICKQYRPGNGQLIIIQHIKLRSNIFYMTKNLFVANRVMYDPTIVLIYSKIMLLYIQYFVYKILLKGPDNEGRRQILSE